MKPLRFAPTADRDLESIGDYIAVDNPRRAVLFIQEIRKRCSLLAEFPQSARPLPELGSNARIVSYKRSVIVYRDRPDEVLVVRVIHGARDIQAILKDMTDWTEQDLT